MLQDNLIRLRKKNDMTQEMLASKIHVTRQTISKWEKGLSVPNADDLLRLSEVFGEDVSALLGTIENSTEQDLNQWHQAENQKKRFWGITLGIIVLIACITGFIFYQKKSTIRYDYVGSQSMIHDASEITDIETINWIQSCDRQDKEYFILFSACSPAEISEGYVGKVLVYIPKGFSSLDYYFNEDSSLFRKGKSMDFQVGSTFTDEKTYQFALIETPQNNISRITLRDVNGNTLEPVVTKTPNQFYVYEKYYELYSK